MRYIFKILVLLLFLINGAYSQDASSVYEKSVKSVGLITDNDKNASGFFVNPTTFVTNYHVSSNINIKNASIKKKNGEVFKIKRIIKENSNTDLALLETVQPSSDYFSLANPNDVKQGQKVYAIGNPAAITDIFEFSFTDGMINNVIKNHKVSTRSMQINAEVILHSASLNKGNSGGPLINDKGEVVGINSFYYLYSNNLYFAIHINELTKLLNLESINYHSGGKSINDSPLIAKQNGTSRSIFDNNVLKSDSGIKQFIKKDSNNSDSAYIVITLTIIFIVFIFIIIAVNKNKNRVTFNAVPDVQKPSPPADYSYINVNEEKAFTYILYNGKKYEIKKTGLMIGRDLTNDIVIADKNVSRHHVRILEDNGVYVLTDLESKNKTLVNIYPVKKCILKKGDVIQIGNEKLIFNNYQYDTV
jgi:hypothetical protein